MIIRILTEGQYDVAEAALARLNELDAAVEAAIATGDEAAFSDAFTALLEGVRSVGVPHEITALDESDLILPPADATMGEVRDLLGDDGLIHG